jgi:hypothetical protein
MLCRALCNRKLKQMVQNEEDASKVCTWRRRFSFDGAMVWKWGSCTTQAISIHQSREYNTEMHYIRNATKWSISHLTQLFRANRMLRIALLRRRFSFDGETLFVWDALDIFNTELHCIRNEATQGVQFSFDLCVHCIVVCFGRTRFVSWGRKDRIFDNIYRAALHTKRSGRDVMTRLVQTP